MTSSPPDRAEPAEAPWLASFPVSMFSTVMGMAGLAVAWMKVHEAAAVHEVIGHVLRWAATLLYVVLVGIYAAKVLLHPDEVAAESADPIQINYFPAISIGLLLLSIAWLPSKPEISEWMWRAGAVIHLFFTLGVMSSWIYHTHYEIRHANPTWFIPVVGNIIVPVAGVGFAPADISWFFFSVGLMFWLVLMTIVLYRLFFHEPLPLRLMPTLFMLIAPPAAGFLSYVALVGDVDAFGRILYFFALFLTVLCGFNALRFARLPFFMSAWAYSFPLAAITLATFEMGSRGGGAFYNALSLVLLAMLSLIVCYLVLRSIQFSLVGRNVGPPRY